MVEYGIFIIVYILGDLMLTQEKLLKMPEKDYMNEAQLQFFRALLKEQKDELSISVAEAKQNLSQTEHNIDLNDVATQQEMQQIYLRTVERQSKLISKINKTIILIDKQEYGYCEISGEPIGLKRLLARPTATMSVSAKEIQEHQERTGGIIR
ncbi:MAG: DnaK suppressor protein [Francisellaceae bacterium]|jgi:DnaK suppressor protein